MSPRTRIRSMPFTRTNPHHRGWQKGSGKYPWEERPTTQLSFPERKHTSNSLVTTTLILISPSLLPSWCSASRPAQTSISHIYGPPQFSSAIAHDVSRNSLSLDSLPIHIIMENWDHLHGYIGGSMHPPPLQRNYHPLFRFAHVDPLAIQQTFVVRGWFDQGSFSVQQAFFASEIIRHTLHTYVEIYIVSSLTLNRCSIQVQSTFYIQFLHRRAFYICYRRE
ncbi:hypothetical protein BJ138DRAFT_101327 [Hygrophoropsis aurantiaca]|uniref:Uncharacterized protein n=1 Tax=Hygrophoropsis aurantiaca TaxID=72124 RepID=A0ACB8AAI2_9AGAM|nr:hypothetical protein BJ138DRAFT_101327 [Hygrophoropsis aurantiaca]